MPTTIRDASLSTARRRQLALFTWRNTDQYSYNPQTQKAEQAPSHGWKGTGPSRDVSLDAQLGAMLIGQTANAAQVNGQCGCSTTVTLQGYDKKSPAQNGGN
jgi:hypothetical protein